jgi:hypothetical protein
MTSLAVASLRPDITSARVSTSGDGIAPSTVLVVLACGSRSVIRVRIPRRYAARVRFTAVVVLPTPPF